MTIEEVIKAQMEGKKVEIYAVIDKEAQVAIRETEKGEIMADVKTSKPLMFDFRIAEEEETQI